MSASGGAVGLGCGVLSLGAKLNERLRFVSPVVDGIALAFIVGVPFSVLAVRALVR